MSIAPIHFGSIYVEYRPFNGSIARIDCYENNNDSVNISFQNQDTGITITKSSTAAPKLASSFRGTPAQTRNQIIQALRESPVECFSASNPMTHQDFKDALAAKRTLIKGLSAMTQHFKSSPESGYGAGVSAAQNHTWSPPPQSYLAQTPNAHEFVSKAVYTAVV